MTNLLDTRQNKTKNEIEKETVIILLINEMNVFIYFPLINTWLMSTSFQF